MAILDINLGGERIEPAAEMIDKRNLPFLFANGYGAAGVPEEFPDRPVLQKLFVIERLAEAIDTALRR